MSGFLIGTILYRLYVDQHFRLPTVLSFLRRRWLRTLPLYYTILLVNILIGVVYSGLPDGLWKYFFFLQNATGKIPLFFVESWSLSVEEFSYVLLPLLLLLTGVVFRPNNRSLFFLLGTCLLLLCSFGARLYFHQTTQNTDVVVWNTDLKMVVVYRLDAIYMGVLCSWIAENFKKFWINSKWMLCFAGLLILCFLFAGIGYFQFTIRNAPLFWNVFYLTVVTTAIALFLPVLSDWKKTEWMISKPIAFVSMISYSVYLWHYSIVLQLMRSWFYQSDRYTFTALYISITLLLSWFTYALIEKPVLAFRDRKKT
ncbi:hypothetical protein HYN48_00100 [Flavobacterium magnum]|uniref:Acyltransferase 3 domain-containing protein n=1 Tax=Flavobacterium magnum TaxID=2162713 RepID=A0A2S0RBJ5_9FLAO|nr:acyltransferase [Flavobacterium magnum]AWA28608.1 hypothetical protein HYN48_00100 [Flavobacterium magnum]